MELVLAGVAVLAVAGLVVSERATRRRDRRWRERFGSDDAFAAAVDRDRIRRIKESDGEVAAVRAVRAEFPDAPLATAAQLVREL